MEQGSEGPTRKASAENVAEHSFALDILHDFGGAILFSMPLLITMEMWWLGFYMDRLHLAQLIAVSLVVVFGISYFEGGEETFKIELLDALVAFAVGFTVAALTLTVMAIVGPGMSPDEVVGKIALQAVPCSIGAILARRQLEVGDTKKERRRREYYGGKLFLMGVGAIFLAFQLAPTEEIVLIAHRLTGWHAAALSILSLVVMQAFIYSTEIKDRPQFSWKRLGQVFFQLTLVGYAIALLICVYILWTFGRLEGADLREVVFSASVLAFPAALGASAARLIL